MAQTGEGKKKAVSAMAWNAAEKLLEQVFYFAIGIILARILSPDDYGIVALAEVFVYAALTLIADSFAEVVIQKRDLSKEDISTAFYFSFGLSLLFYGILFLAAPWIAGFYEKEVLVRVLRVYGLTIPITAYKSFLKAVMKRDLKFRLFFYSSLTGTLIGGCAGVFLALSGKGVWALVAFYILDALTDSIIMTIMIRFTPGFAFNRKSLDKIIGYSFFSVSSGVLSGYVERAVEALIGKLASPAELSFFRRGKQYPDIINANASGMFADVLLPVFSNTEDEDLYGVVRRFIKTATLLQLPLLVGLVLTAKEIIIFLVTEKWLPCVPYLYLISFSYMMVPFIDCNRRVLRSRGEIRRDFQNQVVLSVFQLAASIIALLYFPPVCVAVVSLLKAMINVSLSEFYALKFTGYSLWEQLRDVFPAVLAVGIMAASVFGMKLLTQSWLLQISLILQVLAGAFVYVLVNVLIRNEAFFYLWNILRARFSKSQ